MAFVACTSSDPVVATDAEDGGLGPSSEAGTDAATGTAVVVVDGGAFASDAASSSVGPSAACRASISGFTACGGTIPDATWKATSMCSPAVDTVRSPGCGATGKTTSWFEGTLGAGTITITGAAGATGGMEFLAVRATQRFVADAPQTCARPDCAFAKGNLYGEGPTGTCDAKGTDCHCEWSAQPATQGTGSGPFTTSGTTLTWQGKAIPYCVKGNTLELDLATLFQSIAPLSAATPFVGTFAKQ